MLAKKAKERISLFIVKSPATAILLGILLFNIVLIFSAAFVISRMTLSSDPNTGFWASVFYTISMILDAGCVEYVVQDIGQTGMGLVLVCLATVLIGMITFTGAVIGYITNWVSSFIEGANSGKHPLKISDHTVILNWNSRGSEIINDLLYTGKKETIVILVDSDADAVESEISDRISTTIKAERKFYMSQAKGKSWSQRRALKKAYYLENRLSIVVRQGDTYSSKSLSDIAVPQAKTVILLSSASRDDSRPYDVELQAEQAERGNSETIKTLVQVAEMTSSEVSADDQIVIVEVEDSWTMYLVERVIAHKERMGKSNIIAVPVNKILGQILSQFSIMPELNTVYSNLFSNKGAEFFCRKLSALPETSYESVDREFLEGHVHALPLSAMETKTGPYAFYIADTEEDVSLPGVPVLSGVKAAVKGNYHFKRKNIIIIGHNSKSADIMAGFDAFRGEWNEPGGEVLNIVVIDDKKSLEKRNYYRDYSYVSKVVEAEVFDNELICRTINEAIDSDEEDISVLILSDDSAPPEAIDANALTYLVYVQDIVFRRIEEDSDFDVGKVDIIVEILNPKHYDVVHNYSVNNVVISNRYISKMVTQISRKDSLYEFYCDILTYDDGNAGQYESKELYIKPAAEFFEQIPEPCSAAELIRVVYDGTPEGNKAVVIGYVRGDGETVIFSGDQNLIQVSLSKADKLIVFSNH